MKAKPVDRVRSPRYPTRREVLAGAASFVLVGLSGGKLRWAEAAESGEGVPAGTIVAPIFEHGEGTGAMGCVVVAPSVFLTEEEGMQILREELFKHGIELKPGRILEGVGLPFRWPKANKRDGQTEYEITIVEFLNTTKPMKLDGIDPEKKVAVKFVSQEAYSDLGGLPSGAFPEYWDFKEAAENVATKAKEQGKDHVFLGVFYDPVAKQLSPASPNDSPPPKEAENADRQASPKAPIEPRSMPESTLELFGEDSHAAIMAMIHPKWRERYVQESGKLLRQQVQDFAAWLKEQKAIP